MPCQDVTFTFTVNQQVKVKPLDLPGHVVGVCQYQDGQTYRVVWWSDGDRHDTWLYAHEIV
jgi:hypothetical protein